MSVCLSVRGLWKRVWKTIGMGFLVFLGRFYMQMVCKKKSSKFLVFTPLRRDFLKKVVEKYQNLEVFLTSIANG